MSTSHLGNSMNSHKKLHKKAVVEVQFNWIFILVAGALILFLFSAIILKQKTTADSTAQTTLLKDITSIAIGSEATSGVTKELALSKASISFGCNTLRIGQKSQPLSQMVMFTPTTVQTPLIIHTREWSMPFRATNVVYLSSPKIRYVLIGNDDLAKSINKSMPEKIHVEFYQDYNSFKSIPLQQYDHTRIVFFNPATFNDANTPLNDPLNLFNKMRPLESGEVSILVVNTGNQERGAITFYSKGSNNWIPQTPSVGYLKEEMLIGAIFIVDTSPTDGEDETDQYQCIQNNMLRKLKTVADIHSRRMQVLEQNTRTPNTLDRCNPFYKDTTPTHFPTQTNFNRLITQSPLIFEDLHNAAYGTSGLSAANKQLERLSCPLLY